MLIEKESPKDTFFLKNKIINCKGILLNLDEPCVMGILNLTPDSFFDGKAFFSDEEIIAKTKKMLDDGAKIIDVGGYSTRPNASEVSEKEELNRVLLVVKLLVAEFKNIVISVDTFRSVVAEKCIENGAALINDISGGDYDEKMVDCIATLKVPYVLMHSNNALSKMHVINENQSITDEVFSYFSEKINELTKKGIADIIIDPGFGFGKSLEQNYQLMQQLNGFSIFERPILVGISRKSMLNKVLQTTPQTALNGTTVLNTLALTKGASILRVHDVKEAVEAIVLTEKVSSVFSSQSSIFNPQASKTL